MPNTISADVWLENSPQAEEIRTARDEAVEAAALVLPLYSGKMDKISGVDNRPSDVAFSVSDTDGFRSFEVSNTGTTRIASALSTAYSVGSSYAAPGAAGWLFTVRDVEGNIAFGVRDDLTIAGQIGEEEVVPVAKCLPTDGVVGIMHRGYSSIAPENTIPAYEACVRAGRYVVECDIERTSDGVHVLLHDSTVERTSDGTGAISSLTLADAKLLDFGSWKGAAFTGASIPTWAEFLQFCKRMNLHVVAELKASTWTEAQVQDVLSTISATGMTGRVQLDCFSDAPLQIVKTLSPTTKIGRLGTLSTSLISAAAALKTGANTVAVNVSAASVTASLVTEAHAAGLLVFCWTVNSAASVPALVAAGVDGIITDDLNIQQVIIEQEGL